MQKHSSIPNNESAEKSVLSVIFQNPDTHIKEALAEGLTDDHFYNPSIKTLWTHICELHRAGKELDLITLSAELMRLGKLDELGGPAFVQEIYTHACSSQNWSQHIDILRDRLARRKAHFLALEINDEALSEKSPEELANLAKAASEAIMQVSKPVDKSKSAKVACREFMADFESLLSGGGMPGIPTSMEPIDELTGGMRPGELWVFCGPTSGGKSVAALQSAGSAIRHGKRVGVFSLEMGAGECIGRMISCGYGVDYGMLRNPTEKGNGDSGKASKQQLMAVRRAITDLAETPIVINDEARLTIERIEAQAQKWKDADGLDLLVVDYIQLVQTTRQGEARHEELAMIAGALKQLAKALQVPVITASQLNNEGRMAKAKSIGDDADVVMRIEEDGIYVLKNRNGEKHVTLPLKLNGLAQKFEVSYGYSH